MSQTHADTLLDRLRSALVGKLGLRFDEGRSAHLSEVLQRRCDALSMNPEAYLLLLEHDPPREELRALAAELTVGETYFFRNIDQLRAFSAIAQAAPGRWLSVLSAGCSTGEEPYSLAMLLREEAPGVEATIRAVDLNPLALAKAARGVYSTWALRETSPEHQRRWFRPEGRDFALDPSILAAVQLSEANLTHDDALLWRPGAYDVIFCRNVLMYFSPEQARGVVARIALALRPGGHLFLGHAETLRGLSNHFHLCHTHDTFYYQRKGPLELVADPHPVHVGAAKGEVAPAPWMDAVQRASERIRSLADGDVHHAPATPPRPISNPYIVAIQIIGTPSIIAPIVEPRAGDAQKNGLARPMELLEMERYAEALQLLSSGPASDPDAMLLRASLLIHTGKLEEAEAVCAALLEVDELSAGAHYLIALCREAAGDAAGAIEQDQVATYLDPGFVMPSLHLGLMHRRAGDHEQARRELSRALSQLPDEEPSRLLLFGGGFSREALRALCNAELASLEARS